jgi:3-oxoacyl-[acyl-carrier-protein] synthase-1
MVTSVGHDAPVATTSVLADITRMRQITTPTRHGLPIVGAPIDGSAADEAHREQRLWMLAARAAGEALDEADARGQPLERSNCGVLWIAPQETRPGYKATGDQVQRDSFLQECKIDTARTRWLDLPRGHAGALMALREASIALARGSVDGCLIGGVDTLLQLRVLRWLEAQDRLKHETYTDGLIPGEAAAFLVVERLDSVRRRGGRILAEVKGFGAAFEEASIESDSPCRALGLTAAFRSALASAGMQPQQVSAVYCDLNGESYRAREWALASTRIGFPDSPDLLHPADCLGDVGAATGPLLLSLAATTLADSAAAGSNILVFAGSETGERAAVVLEAPQTDYLRASDPNAAAVGRRVGKAIPDVLDEHADEISFLWGNRELTRHSPDLFPNALLRLDRRIEAHVRGFLAAGESAIGFLAPQALAPDEGLAFAAGYVLLRTGTRPAAGQILRALEAADERSIDGLSKALCQGPIDAVIDSLREQIDSADQRLAVAAGEALAFHDALTDVPDRLGILVESPSPLIRRAAWRILALLGSAHPRVFRVGLRDPDPIVRRESLFAAAWARQESVLDHCRKIASAPTPDEAAALELLAILGGSEDLPLVLTVGRTRDLGPLRYRILGMFGHPNVVDCLLEGIEDPDCRSSCAAGAAFSRVTGCTIDSGRHVEARPERGGDADEFEQHFLDDLVLPDPRLANDFWLAERSRFLTATRWARGLSIQDGASFGGVARLDLQARWESCLRGKWHRTWDGGLADLERLACGSDVVGTSPVNPRSLRQLRPEL